MQSARPRHVKLQALPTKHEATVVDESLDYIMNGELLEFALNIDSDFMDGQFENGSRQNKDDEFRQSKKEWT